jgi:hypothetical protein
MSTQVVKGGLRAARLARGWSVDQLVSLLIDAAAHDGTGRGTWDAWRIERCIRTWEDDHGTPGERYVYLLCEVFGATPAELGLRWNLGVYRAKRQAEASRQAEADASAKAAFDASGDWSMVPLWEVVRAARSGDQGAADALAFAEMTALWGAA